LYKTLFSLVLPKKENMTPFRKHAIIQKAKEITLSTGLIMSILSGSTLLQNCSNSSTNGAEGEYEEVEEYKKGVKTYLSETAPGKFKIQNEVATDVDSSLAEITYLDGHKQSLNAQAVKTLVDQHITENKENIGKNENLANTLLYSGMGFLLAKTISPNYVQYRPDMDTQMAHASKDSTSRRHQSRGFFYPILFSRFYASPAVFDRSNAVHNSITNSRTVSYRPAGGRSGFFRSTGRSSFRS
jgi:hypothetical protein